VTEAILKHNIQLLTQLTRFIVGECFKRMARDEMLSKFMSLQVDPALFVDLHLQVEREAIHLTEISLLELVTPDRLRGELRKSGKKLQDGFQLVYGEENPVIKDFLNQNLIQFRELGLRARVEFYNPLLTVERKGENFLDLANLAYNRPDRFLKKIEGVLEADRRYNEELVRQTESLHRFLMKKQTEYELQKMDEIWKEFLEEAFRSPAALP